MATDDPLGNGQNSNGYAIKGVEFTILQIADIVTFTEPANATTVKYALEVYIKSNNGILMDKTNENGKTIKRDLPAGLYLCVETANGIPKISRLRYQF